MHRLFHSLPFSIKWLSLSNLQWIVDLRTAITCVSHTICISVCLHGVGYLWTVIQHVRDACKKKVVKTDDVVQCCKTTEQMKMNGTDHLHPDHCHRCLPCHCHQYQSDLHWERWGSYHKHRHRSLCQSSADLCWALDDSCPAK